MHQPILDLIYRGLATLEAPDQQSDRSSKERTATLLDQLDRLKQITRELTKKIEDVACDVIEQHGDIEVGDIRWYVGTEKKVTCLGNAAALGAMLDATAGDLEAVGMYLASDAFKHGGCKDLLGEEVFAKHFQTEVKRDLKDGKPLRGLKKFDKKVDQFKKPKAPKET